MKPRDRRNEGLSAHERKIMALELPKRKENTPVFTNKNKKPYISKSTSTLAETMSQISGDRRKCRDLEGGKG